MFKPKTSIWFYYSNMLISLLVPAYSSELGPGGGVAITT